MSTDRDHADPALDALLRAHSTEAPPAAVDAAVLAAAHRAVESDPRGQYDRALARQPWRWWMPLAAAAVIGVIAIGVLPLAPMAPDEPSSIVSDSPEPSADPPQHRETPIGGEAAETDSSTTSRAAAAPEATPKLQDKRATPAAPAMPDAGPPTARRANTFSTPPPTAQHERSDATKPAPQESGVAAPSGPGSTLSAAPGRRSSDDERSASRRELAAGGAPSLKALEAEPRGAAEWIARIRLLHAEGRLAEAKEELGRFRAAFDDADARLPAELRAWAGSLR